MTFFDNFTQQNLVAAHRGFRACWPENTLAAFQAAIGRCHFIELDVQVSKDLIPVVIHDSTLKRTSNGETIKKLAGAPSLAVHEWNLKQLKMLDVGTWFVDADPFGTLLTGDITVEQISARLPQRIMTLEEVLTHKELRSMPINVEIKDHGARSQELKITERVLRVIHKTAATPRVLLSSFNHDYLLIAKSLLPGLSTAALQQYRHPPGLTEYLRSLDVAAYHPADSITDRPLVKELRSAGFGVNVYTVNSRVRQQNLYDFGVTAVFTDYPELPFGQK